MHDAEAQWSNNAIGGSTGKCLAGRMVTVTQQVDCPAQTGGDYISSS